MSQPEGLLVLAAFGVAEEVGKAGFGLEEDDARGVVRGGIFGAGAAAAGGALSQLGAAGGEPGGGEAGEDEAEEGPAVLGRGEDAVVDALLVGGVPEAFLEGGGVGGVGGGGDPVHVGGVPRGRGRILHRGGGGRGGR